MLPLKDNQPTSTFPIVTVLIIITNVVIFLAQPLLGLDRYLVLVPAAVLHNTPVVVHYLANGQSQTIVNAPDAVRPVWLTVFTSMFLHSGIVHIGGNMLYLWIFGNNIEDALGKVRFLIFYFVCGLCAAFTQVLSDPNSTVPVLGASGAIAGVLGAYYVLYPQARVLTFVPVVFAFLFELRAWFVLGAWFVLQIVTAILSFGMQQGGVALFAHVGGFIAGVLLIKLMGGRKLAQTQYRRSSYYPPNSRPYRYF